MSERSIHLHTPVDVSVPAEPNHRLSQAERHKHKPRFSEFACSHVEVGVSF